MNEMVQQKVAFKKHQVLKTFYDEGQSCHENENFF
jgi:hypothetical protein